MNKSFLRLSLNALEYTYIGIQLVYNVVLISAVLNSSSIVHLYYLSYSFPLWFITGY